MDLVIIGLSQLALHVSRQLSVAGHNVTIVETSSEVIERASLELDVSLKLGSGMDVALLQELASEGCDLLLACSECDEKNLAVCALAKAVGMKKVAARVKNAQLIRLGDIDLHTVFNIDYILSPQWLAASEIIKFLTHEGALGVTNYAHGQMQMRQLRISETFKYSELPLSELKLPKATIIALIHRHGSDGSAVIFPHGEDTLHPLDEIVVIGSSASMGAVHTFFGLKNQSSTRVMIYGLSLLTFHLTTLLSRLGIETKIICDHPEQLKVWGELIGGASLIYKPRIDTSFLIEHHAHEYDLFIASGSDDQDNLCAALMAQDVGCKQTAVTLSDPVLSNICTARGITLTLSPYDIAASQLTTLALGDNISSVVSLYNHSAELLQIHITPTCSITGHPIKNLRSRLPKSVILGIIERSGHVQIATGESTLEIGDTLIALCHPSDLDQLKKLL